MFEMFEMSETGGRNNKEDIMFEMLEKFAVLEMEGGNSKEG